MKQRLFMIACMVLASLGMRGEALAIAIAPFYAGSYSFTDLGSVPGLPAQYGGLTFKAGDANTLLIGGNANTASGRLYEIGVTRGAGNHITGFTGSAVQFGNVGEYNDGGVVYGPGGVLFTSRWPVNDLGQTKPGSTDEDKIIDLAALGVGHSHAAINFVPTGFPGAGQMKLVSWSGGQWYTAAFSPDGTGTFNIDSVTLEVDIIGGPEGFVYVNPGSPLFASFDSMLVSEYSANRIAAYTLDANGDPEPLSRQDFITDLSGAEGAVIDPITGDFLFSTFGGGNRVVVVQGFATPPPPPPPGVVPEPTTLVLMGLGLAGLFMIRRRK